MMGLLVYKEKLKNFYAEHEFYVNPIIKFISAFIALTRLRSLLGLPPIKGYPKLFPYIYNTPFLK